ncbi:nitrogen regulation protein NR(II) [Spirosoma rhododendri]|uniref:hypothetical protein n=1 Tax=Spirosoma rhododendri TaxID=2728024 RepID=UPI0020C2CADC|nr:hypothetical protein [Spirosoma rhododendri]
MTSTNDEAPNPPPCQSLLQDYCQVLCNASDQGLCLVELVVDQAGKITDLIVRQYNQAFSQQSGLSNVVGEAYSQILPRFETYWFEAYAQVAKTDKPIQLEQYVQDLDRWIRTKLSRVGPLGSRLVVVAFDDVTTIKKRELALLDADRRKDEFLAMLGHELRNPLGVIANTLTYLELSGGRTPNCLIHPVFSA